VSCFGPLTRCRAPADGNGAIEYKELDRLLRNSCKKQPKLAEITSKPLAKGGKAPTAKAQGGKAASQASSPSSKQASPKKR